MAKIYRTTDRVEVMIGDITIKIAPLNAQQKNEIQRLLLKGQAESDIVTLNNSMVLAIKYCLKSIKGVQDADGNEYQLEFDSGMVTDACIDDLMNMEESATLVKVCGAFIGGIPKSFDIEGVSIVDQGKKS